MLKAKYLNLYDLEDLSSLISTNVALKDALLIIKQKRNTKIINEIIYRLDKGDIFEDIIYTYLPNNISVYFKAFMSYLSFENALNITISIINKEKRIKENLAKDLAYPLLMLTVSVVGIYLFNEYGFNPLLNSVSSFSDDLAKVYKFKSFIDILIKSLFIMIIIFLSGVLYFSRRKRLVFAYILLQKYIPNSIIKEYLSSRFVLYFNECTRIGIKTKDSITILKSLKQFPLISFIAYHVNEAFLEGESIENAMKNKYLDYRLSRILKISLYNGKMVRMLESYMDNFEKRFKKKCQNFSKYIQVISYVLIGVIIVFVYQILFIPMSAIGGFNV